jgi:hypothetical protein
MELLTHILLIFCVRSGHAGTPVADQNGMALGSFLLYYGIGAALWVGALLTVGRFFGYLLKRYIQFTLGPVDSLDHSSRLPNYGSKMGIDAKRKWKAEGFTRPWPSMIEMDRAQKAKEGAMWAKLGL